MLVTPAPWPPRAAHRWTLERSEHIAEWVRLTEGKLQSAQPAPILASATNPKGAGRKESGINAGVRELGIDRTEAQRAGWPHPP